MKDKRLEKMAKVLVNYSMRIQKGEFFLIEGNYLAMPLMKEVFKEALIAGANPTFNVVPDELIEIFYKYAGDEQFAFQNPVRLYEMEKVDAFLTIWGNNNTRYLNNIDAAKMKKAKLGRKKEIDTYHERSGKKIMKWCGTQFATQADAQEAGMSLEEYEDFIFRACLVDRDDPVAEWMKIRKEQDRIVKILDRKSEFVVKSQDTDIKLSTSGRNWVNCWGDENMPDGEVYTGPVENSLEGHIRFSFPGIYNGKEVDDIRLTFKEGKVVEARAEKGQDFLLSLLDTDEGARHVGEFAIGTNYGIKDFTRNMLFDEKIGGTIHLALGMGFEDSGSKNDSLIHWDMLCDMRKGGEIYADGELIYKDGKLLI